MVLYVSRRRFARETSHSFRAEPPQREPDRESATDAHRSSNQVPACEARQPANPLRPCHRAAAGLSPRCSPGRHLEIADLTQLSAEPAHVPDPDRVEPPGSLQRRPTLVVAELPQRRGCRSSRPDAAALHRGALATARATGPLHGHSTCSQAAPGLEPRPARSDCAHTSKVVAQHGSP
jgi:hypothetical protein